jgi:hypothetical protein
MNGGMVESSDTQGIHKSRVLHRSWRMSGDGHRDLLRFADTDPCEAHCTQTPGSNSSSCIDARRVSSRVQPDLQHVACCDKHQQSVDIWVATWLKPRCLRVFGEKRQAFLCGDRIDASMFARERSIDGQ